MVANHQPQKYLPAVADNDWLRVLEYVRQGMCLDTAAESCGIEAEEARARRKNDPEFARQMLMAEAHMRAEVEKSIAKAALGGKQRTRNVRRIIVDNRETMRIVDVKTKDVPPDSVAARMYMGGRRPELYGPDAGRKDTGRGTIQINIAGLNLGDSVDRGALKDNFLGQTGMKLIIPSEKEEIEALPALDDEDDTDAVDI